MTTRRAITEGQIIWTVEGEDAVEASGRTAEQSAKKAGRAAEESGRSFDGWFTKVTNLSKAMDEGLNENVQSLFLGTDRLNSILGAATGASELFNLALTGLSAAYEAVTGAAAEAAEKAERHTREMERQERQAEETTTAMAALASATSQSILDATVRQTIDYTKALQEQKNANEQLAAAQAQRTAFEQEQFKRQGFQLGFERSRSEALAESSAEVERLEKFYRALDGTEKGRFKGLLENEISRRDALADELAALDATLQKATERASAAELSKSAIEDQIKAMAQAGDAANELALAALEKAKSDDNSSGSVKAQVESTEALGRALDRVRGIGGDLLEQATGIMTALQNARIQAVAAMEADYQAVVSTLSEPVDDPGLGSFVDDLLPGLAELERKTDEVWGAFRSMYAGIGEGAAASLVDVVIFGESAKRALNDLANAALQEAAIGAALEGAKALVQLAIGNIAGAALHGKAALAYGGVALVAGAVAAGTGGVGGAGASSGGRESIAPPSDLSRRDGRGEGGDSTTIINQNFIARDGPQARRDTRRWAAESSRAIRRSAA